MLEAGRIGSCRPHHRRRHRRCHCHPGGAELALVAAALELLSSGWRFGSGSPSDTNGWAGQGEARSRDRRPPPRAGRSGRGAVCRRDACGWRRCGAATAAGEAWLMTAPARGEKRGWRHGGRDGVGRSAARHQPRVRRLRLSLGLSFNCHKKSRHPGTIGFRPARRRATGRSVLATPFGSWIGKTGIKSVQP